MLLIASGGLLQACHADQNRDWSPVTFLLIQQLPSWEPGQERRVSQVFLSSQGAGQKADIVDHRVLETRSFKVSTNDWTDLDPDTLTILEDRYFIPQDPGLIEEGNPDSHKFTLCGPEVSKIIDVHTQVEPGVLKRVRKEADKLAAGAPPDEASEMYLTAEALGPNVAESDLGGPILSAGSDLISARPWMAQTLAQPGLLVGLSREELADWPEQWGPVPDANGIEAYFKTDCGLLRVKTFLGPDS